MNLIKRSLKFAHRNIFKNTRFFITYVTHYFDKDFALEANFIDEEELNKALMSGKSLVRYGDGEIHLLNYGDIHYEPQNPRLRNYLLKAVEEYTDDSPYIIGLPQQYIDMSNSDLRKISLLHCWLPLKVTFRNIFPKQARYFDAHQFYRGNSFERILEKQLKNKKVIIVTRQYNIDLMLDAGIKDKLDVTFITTPDNGSFSEFDSILDRILAEVSDPDQTRVLASAGPASKPLVYELSKRGIISYDIGKGAEAVYRKNEIEKMI